MTPCSRGCASAPSHAERTEFRRVGGTSDGTNRRVRASAPRRSRGKPRMPTWWPSRTARCRPRPRCVIVRAKQRLSSDAIHPHFGHSPAGCARTFWGACSGTAARRRARPEPSFGRVARAHAGATRHRKEPQAARLKSSPLTVTTAAILRYRSCVPPVGSARRRPRRQPSGRSPSRPRSGTATRPSTG
jgi:hypothetical protein